MKRKTIFVIIFTIFEFTIYANPSNSDFCELIYNPEDMELSLIESNNEFYSKTEIENISSEILEILNFVRNNEKDEYFDKLINILNDQVYTGNLFWQFNLDYSSNYHSLTKYSKIDLIEIINNEYYEVDFSKEFFRKIKYAFNSNRKIKINLSVNSDYYDVIIDYGNPSFLFRFDNQNLNISGLFIYWYGE